jgi:hypothetical protein
MMYHANARFAQCSAPQVLLIIGQQSADARNAFSMAKRFHYS